MKHVLCFDYTISFLLVFFVLSACSSVDVNSDYNHSFDFTQLTTYKILKEFSQNSGNGNSSLADEKIKNAIELEMTKKGIGKNEKLADYGITWNTKLNDVDKNDALKNWNSSFSGGEKGMLIIDAVDIKTNKIIWRGWSKNAFTGDDFDEVINDVVADILSLFPPEHLLETGK